MCLNSCILPLAPTRTPQDKEGVHLPPLAPYPSINHPTGIWSDYIQIAFYLLLLPFMSSAALLQPPPRCITATPL